MAEQCRGEVHFYGDKQERLVEFVDSFDEDRVTAYELGAKWGLSGGNLLINSGLLISNENKYPEAKEAETFTVKFNPLWNIDKKTDADIRKLNAESDKLDLETGKSDGDTLREKDPYYNDAKAE